MHSGGSHPLLSGVPHGPSAGSAVRIGGGVFVAVAVPCRQAITPSAYSQLGMVGVGGCVGCLVFFGVGSSIATTVPIIAIAVSALLSGV